MSKKNRGPRSLEYEIDSEGLDDVDETETPSTESDEEELELPGMVVNAERVNVRATPEKVAGNEIYVLSRGDSFTILELVGDYCKVRLDEGRIGYIAYEFCKEV